MKRILTLLICLLYLTSLCACKKAPQANTTVNPPSSNEQTNDEPKKEPVLIDKPLYSVSMPIIAEAYLADDGQEIYRHIYQNMDLILPDPEVANKVFINFLNRTDTASASEALLSAAKAAYQGQEDWTPHLCQITFDPMRIDQGVLSLFGSYATFNSSAHPESSIISANYDLLTGQSLSLEDVLTDSATSDFLCKEVINSLNLIRDEKYLFAGFEATVAERFSKELMLETDWYFSENGLCFFFSPYEIASYASGIITAEIPYSKLPGILNDAYMPAERDTVDGTASIKRFDQSNADVGELAELTLNESSDRILITADSEIQKVRIEIGTLSSDGNTFYKMHTVFAASSITKDSGVVLEVDLSTYANDIRISYLSGTETVYTYISEETVK